jgi:hypothetical protein
MIDHGGALLPSVYIGIPVLLAGIIICLVLAVLIGRGSGEDDSPERRVVAGFFTVCAAAALIIAGFGYYPYGGDYHRLQPVDGAVAAVDSRFLATSQYIVVTYDTGLTVRCAKNHQFGSPTVADGWVCRWGQAEMPNAPYAWAGVGQTAAQLAGRLR